MQINLSMRNLTKTLELLAGSVLWFGSKLFWYLYRAYQMSLFKKCGESVYIGRNCDFTYKNTTIGNNVYIGNNACLKSAHGKIVIGNHVMLGPNVHIHGGNHNYDLIGIYMTDNHSKNPDEDGVVKICDDVWIGSGAYIMKGVTVGEGSVIGACTIVLKDVAPYSIIMGSLERKISRRFDKNSLAKHKMSIQKSHLQS